MLCHRLVGRLNLFRNFCGAKESGAMVLFSATIGVNQLSRETIEMWTTRQIHHASRNKENGGSLMGAAAFAGQASPRSPVTPVMIRATRSM